MYRRSQPIKHRVHFSAEDISLENDDSGGESDSISPLRSPPPAPAASPTSSGSSDSTPGPLTPPDLPYSILLDPKDPANFVYGTPSPSGKPKLAPVLFSARVLHWDMAKNPLSVIKRMPLDGGNDRAGCMPSGDPISDMIVIFDEALVDWPLHIQAPRGETLTVHRVWLAIHDHLMKLVSQDYFYTASPELQVRVLESYSDRTREGGVRRIDYMPGRVYVGLSPKAGRHGWEYHLTSTDR